MVVTAGMGERTASFNYKNSDFTVLKIDNEVNCFMHNCDQYCIPDSCIEWYNLIYLMHMLKVFNIHISAWQHLDSYVW